LVGFRRLRLASFAALLVLVAISFYSIVSVLYLRSLGGVLIPALLLGVFFYVSVKFAEMQIQPGWVLHLPHWLVIGMIVLPGIALLGQLTFNLMATDLDGKDTFQFAISFWVVGVFWFLVGAATATAELKSSNYYAIGIVVVLFSIVLIGSEGAFVIHYGNLSRGLDGIHFTHLNTSDYAVFILALAYGLASTVVRYLVVLGAVSVLFALGGRSALLSFAAAVVIHQTFYALRSAESRIWGCVVLVGALLAFFVLLSAVDVLDLAGKDLLFSQGYKSDSSVAARIEFVELAISDLGRQALFGDPSLFVKRFSTIGAYMHNLLSAWQFYGFVFFMVVVVALLGALRLAYKLRKVWNDCLSSAFGLLIVYVLISVIVGRSVTFYLLWLVLGFWLERWILWRSFGTRDFLPATHTWRQTEVIDE